VPFVRQLDLVVLALALPVFLLAGLPMLGYAVAAGAWLAQWAIHVAAERRAAASLAAGDRRSALGVVAATTLGRVWLVALAVLLVGVLADREDGLAAAVLSAGLVTAYLVSLFVARVLAPPAEGR
jgi:hypothetical protein